MALLQRPDNYAAEILDFAGRHLQSGRQIVTPKAVRREPAAIEN
jgi:hypothetical protein